MKKWIAKGTSTTVTTPSGKQVKVADVKAINSAYRKDQQQKAAGRRSGGN